MKKLLSLSFSKIVAISACIVLCVHLAGGAVADMKINSAYKDGSLAGSDLTVADFELGSIVERKIDGEIKHISTDTDPQLLYTVDGLFTNMVFYMENTMPQTEIVVYYTTADGQGFSEKQRLWAQPVKGRENCYSFSLPMQYVHTLRIDPAVTAGSIFTFGDFQLNKEEASCKTPPDYSPSLADHFGVSAADIPFFVLYTGLLASIIRFIQDLFTKKSD